MVRRLRIISSIRIISSRFRIRLRILSSVRIRSMCIMCMCCGSYVSSSYDVWVLVFLLIIIHIRIIIVISISSCIIMFLCIIIRLLMCRRFSIICVYYYYECSY